MYVEQLLGFEDKEDHVYKLNKALYVFKKQILLKHSMIDLENFLLIAALIRARLMQDFLLEEKKRSAHRPNLC